MMRKLLRITRCLLTAVTYLSALLSALTLFPLRRLGGWGIALGPVKRVASALSLRLAIAGGLGALAGLARLDLKAALAGLFGAAAAARHVRRVAAPHTAFEEAFGPDWRARIPPDLAARMLSHRWALTLGLSAPYVAYDLSYSTWPKTEEDLSCALWPPLKSARRTGLAILYLHGGGWHYGDKNRGTRTLFNHLIAQGHLVMEAAYTLAPKANLYGMLTDVKRAIAWLKINAAALGIDPERVVLMGASAGGHLALLAAYTPNAPRFQPANLDMDTSVRAVAAFCPPVDIAAAYHDWGARFGGWLTGRTTLEKWVISTLESLFYADGFLPPYGRYIPVPQTPVGVTGGAPEAVPEVYRLASPLTHVGPHCPPTLLLQGTHDLYIDPSHACRLHKALRAAGVTSVYIEYADADHAFDLTMPKRSPAAQAAIYDMERFLALML